LEAVTLLISATVHDVGHPGFNNAFMVAVGTSQALIYNDQSVLENYHCSLTFQIIQKEKNNILKNMSKEDKNNFRKILVNNVLSTDLSKHFPIIKKFESAIEAGLNLNDEQNKHMAMAVALKCGGRVP
jgi:HD superfamily phosphohydrolase